MQTRKNREMPKSLRRRSCDCRRPLAQCCSSRPDKNLSWAESSRFQAVRRVRCELHGRRPSPLLLSSLSMVCLFGLTRASAPGQGFAQEAIASCPTPTFSYNSTLHSLLLRWSADKDLLAIGKVLSSRGTIAVATSKPSGSCRPTKRVASPLWLGLLLTKRVTIKRRRAILQARPL